MCGCQDARFIGGGGGGISREGGVGGGITYNENPTTPPRRTCRLIAFIFLRAQVVNNIKQASRLIPDRARHRERDRQTNIH